MNQYPVKPLMDEMAQYGRYGDSMLVHMNPIEVAGIASLSPTGQLTTNPVTGQPEAFLPFLPIIAGIGIKSLGLGALATGALTGVATAAITGDLKRGLISGLTAGVAGGIADLGAEAAQASTDVLTTGAEIGTTGVDIASQAADASTLASDIASFADSPVTGLTADGVRNVAGLGADTLTGLTPDQMASSIGSVYQPIESALPAGFDTAAAVGNVSPEPFDFMTYTPEFIEGMSPMQATALAGVGSGQLAQMDVQDDLAAQAAAREAEREEKLAQAYGDLYGAQMAAQPDLAMGMSPRRSIMSDIIPYRPTMGMAEGGATSAIGDLVDSAKEKLLNQLEEGQGGSETQGTNLPPVSEVPFNVGFHGREQEILQKAEMGNPLTAEEQQILERYYNRYEEARQAREDRFDAANPEGNIDYQALAQQAGGFFGYTPAGGTGIDPVSVQAGLRGQYSVAPPKDYMAGFEPEFTYFQDDPNAPFIPDRGYRPVEGGVESSGGYFDPILDREEYNRQLKEYYTMLGSYMPGEVEYPEEAPPIEDDPDTVGTPIGGGAGELPDVDPVDPEEPYDPEVPENGPYAHKYDAWRRNSDYILDKVRRNVPLTDSEQNWYKKYEAGLIVDPRFRPEGFQVPASFDEAMALFNSGGYEGITTVGFGVLDDYDRGEEERYPRPTTKSGTGSSQAKLQGMAKGGQEALERMKGIRGSLGGAGIKGALKGVISQATPQGDGPRGGIAAGPAYESDIIEPGENVATIVRGSDDEYTDLSPEEKEYMQEAYILKFQAQANNGNQGVLSDDNYDYRRYLELGYPPLSKEDKERIGVVEMQAGGEVPIRTPMGETTVPAGGIANMPTEFSASMPTEQEFNMLISAIAGQADNADQIIEMFIERYGVDMFSQIREMVLQSIVPNAQTEGMIEGNGSGMDDMVGGMIGDQQPVAVSPGEYIVPADVVSGLGDGSSDAGAEELDQMMSRVRMARGGTTEQAPPIDAKRMMPA